MAHYAGPSTVTTDRNRLALDRAGNLYMAGTDTWVRYLTVKYGRNGNQLWAVHYVGPGNGTYDVAAALAVDGQGAAFVTGRSLGSTGVYDYATVKYDPNGNQVWVARYDGPAHANDHATALAVDGLGQVYVTGESTGIFFDYATVKYDTNGNQLWVARYNGPGNNDDSAVVVAVDLTGNVYVTGNSVGVGPGPDIATIKYDSTGHQLWVARYDGPAHSYDSAVALAVDAAGCVYVTGASIGSSLYNEYVTIKYAPNGTPLWTARYHGPGNYSDFPAAIALDVSNNVYVTGQSWGAGTLSDYATIKYDADGNQQWVARYNGPGNSYDVASSLVLDGKGGIFVTGSSTGAGTGYDFATVKYNAAGQLLWVERFDAPGHTNDSPNDLVVDGAGNIFLTGISCGFSAGATYDYLTLKYALETRLDSCRRLSDGAFEFCLSGEPGRSYEVQASTNLSNWTSLWVATNSAGTVVCQDAAATNSARRFYRALKQP
jgi:hypothetical protein